MPYHVEVRRSFHRAWAFNLDRETLRRTILDPWESGIALRLGDRDWEPAQSFLRVLEGELLHPADLAHGQGWNHASRGGRDVARELLATVAAAGRATIIATTDDGRAAVRVLLDELQVELVTWSRVRAALLAPRRTMLVDAALLVVDASPSPMWHFEAGLALGALSARVVPVALSAAAPTQIEGLRTISIDGAATAVAAELADRLRLAGCAVRPRPATQP